MLESLLCGFGVLALILGSIGVGVGILAVEGRIEEWRSKRQHRAAAAFTRYAATRSIRDIKRQAILDLLDAECDYYPACHGDVIEGTAVEVVR
jgi:hypothetical protein